MGASNAAEVWINCDFRSISHFISEMIQDRAIIIMECQYKLKYVIYRMLAIFNDPERPLPTFQGHIII